MKRLSFIAGVIGILGASGAAAQTSPPRMTQAEGLQLFQAAGFTIAGGKAINVCGTASTPKFTYLDLNGDGAPEGVAVDKNVSCYGGAGEWFTVVAKGRDGRWRAIARDTGALTWEPTRTAGWLDARVLSNCPRIWKYAGDGYVRPNACAAEPAGRPAAGGVTAADKAAAMRAAGFISRGGKWTNGEGECEAFIEPEGVRDLNGDGRKELIITETGSYCYGNTGQGFYLMEKAPAGAWRTVYQTQGIPEILATKGAGGWPDIEVGGPGFCFPIIRYNGKTYAFNRKKEYQPGACARR